MESGHANVEKLQEKFLEKASDDWKPVVTSTVAKCEEELKSNKYKIFCISAH